MVWDGVVSVFVVVMVMIIITTVAILISEMAGSSVTSVSAAISTGSSESADKGEGKASHYGCYRVIRINMGVLVN